MPIVGSGQDHSAEFRTYGSVHEMNVLPKENTYGVSYLYSDGSFTKDMPYECLHNSLRKEDVVLGSMVKQLELVHPFV